ncbi:hypothetical protein F0A16_04230 [Salinicola corii]|uniref:Uncharacterized protein n=1 Tax=Salinicola corii TaxID=2606937 RepID=A0A640WGX5_9GAMM|nr:hypothetical protein [Salinicola corii]KAA0019558.1 hypothetical protein F0A16_04230 [Salinicola corii]
MKDIIACTRCVHSQPILLESHVEWDEINCAECGEFLDTVGQKTSWLTSSSLKTISKMKLSSANSV